MLPSWCSDTLKVFRAPLINERGAMVFDWDNAESHDISGCSIIVTEERKKSVLFSEPDYTGGIVVITRR